MQALIHQLEKAGELLRISDEVDPYLEMSEIQRQVFQAEGPAVFFERVKGSPFPAICNIFGTKKRAHLLLEPHLSHVKKLVRYKANPGHLLKDLGREPLTSMAALFSALHAIPVPCIAGMRRFKKTTLSALPQIHSWPDDGGAFVLLPQVCSEDPEKPGIWHSNLGMYRVQISGNDYHLNEQAGLHYQIHRGIGVHHSKAISRGQKLRVSVFVGGPAAHTLAAVMPLPEGLSELLFAGVMAGRNFRYFRHNNYLFSADADFVITGTIDPEKTLPEGPFGDHLGYYSLKHDFPYLDVDGVYYREGAIWPFTAVGRPPQEDTSFGQLIHEITSPIVPIELPGVKAIHAVDEAGVHPLLLAIGSERYTPYQKLEAPQELLTQANAILGFGQCSLAKYLLICADQDNPTLAVDNIHDFFCHLLSRVNWSRDLHFQTSTTIDTLDYSGCGVNSGSKVVIAACGTERRRLLTSLTDDLGLPQEFSNPKIALPGVICLTGPKITSSEQRITSVKDFTSHYSAAWPGEEPALIVICDDSNFCASSLKNFLWITFTRSNPASDIHGIKEFTTNKHWGCHGPLVIDARRKPHHAPELIQNPEVERSVKKRLDDIRGY
ncbi:MAG: UbiD family decarboxylase [bacterium]|nr:UbiD family decarboxylase [bacterium]